MEIVLQVFDTKMWEKKLKEMRAELHRAILTTALADKIIPRWQKRPYYPVQSGTAESKEDEEEKVERMRTWERFANEDPDAVRLFVAPLWESINFDEISCADNPTMATLPEWIVPCLVAAMDKPFSLQRGARDPATGKIKGES